MPKKLHLTAKHADRSRRRPEIAFKFNRPGARPSFRFASFAPPKCLARCEKALRKMKLPRGCLRARKADFIVHFALLRLQRPTEKRKQAALTRKYQVESQICQKLHSVKRLRPVAGCNHCVTRLPRCIENSVQQQRSVAVCNHLCRFAPAEEKSLPVGNYYISLARNYSEFLSKQYLRSMRGL